MSSKKEVHPIRSKAANIGAWMMVGIGIIFGGEIAFQFLLAMTLAILIPNISMLYRLIRKFGSLNDLVSYDDDEVINSGAQAVVNSSIRVTVAFAFSVVAILLSGLMLGSDIAIINFLFAAFTVFGGSFVALFGLDMYLLDRRIRYLANACWIGLERDE